MESAAYAYFARIDELGGMVEAIKTGFPQREIADAAFEYQREVERKERIVVGVNEYRLENDDVGEIHRPDPEAEARQRARLGRTKAARDEAAVEASLDERPPRRRRRRQPDAGVHRRGAGARLGGRDRRGAPGGVRHLHRAPPVLSAAATSRR